MSKKSHVVTWTWSKGKVILTCSCGEFLGKFPNLEEADKASMQHRF